MNIVLAYIMVPHIATYQSAHQRFAESYAKHPPGEDHSTVVICNGCNPDKAQREMFSHLPNVEFVTRSNGGWDIGGYIDCAKHVDADMMVCFGASTYFNKPNWLARMAKTFRDSKPGLYGTCASYQVRPHLNTSGFFCDPDLLRRYPHTVRTKADRYDFEHGPNSLWILVAREKMPVKLVLWSGAYGWMDWRRPPNCSWRGTQENCIASWHLLDAYRSADARKKRILSSWADTLTDPVFKKLRMTKGGEL